MDKLGFIKMLKFCFLNTIKRMKGQGTAKWLYPFTFPPVGNKSFRSFSYILANTYYDQSF